jgi:hypothetical protein
MKSFLILFIMASLSFKLNAFDTSEQLNGMKLNTFNDFNDPKLKEVIEKAKNNGSDFGYKFVREEELKNDRSCSHCPKYLLLTDAVNKVVDKIAKDPKSGISDELPVKINRLKFLYYTEALRNQNGDILCQRFMDITPDLRPTKFDGQFKLIAEDALKFSSVSEIQYMNPALEEVVYYYRGVEGDKNIVVQAILTKNGGKFRYYRYTPSEKESDPYNLPDMEKNYGPVIAPTLADTMEFKDVLDSDPKGLAAAPENYKLKFKTEVEKRNRFIPKNVHFIEASIDQDVAAGISVKGSSDTSLTGNAAHLAIKNGASDMVLVDLDTKLSGKTEHRITIPYSIHMLDTLPDYALKGKIQHENEAEIVTMSLTDKSVEYLRSEYRKNTNTNKDSYVFARDVKLDTNEILSVQYGKNEEDKRYASLKHSKTLKDNITLVLDVRVDQDKKVSLFYQVNAKF